jgi:hypothetical protein
MKTGTHIALAVGFGYLLGRRKKLRKALALAGAAAVGRASLRPGGLAGIAGNLLSGTGQLGDLGRLGAPLATAGKAAVTAAAGSGIEAVSGKLRDRTESMRRRTAASRQAGQQDDEPEADERYDDQEPEDEYDEEPAAPAKRSRVPAGGRRRGR